MSLYEEITALTQTCRVQEEFISDQKLGQILTRERIKANLPNPTSLRFDDILSHFTEPLATSIDRKARRIFAILVIIRNIPAIRDLIRIDGITDQDLPLSRIGNNGTLKSETTNKIFTSFKSWKPAEIDTFLQEQILFQTAPFSKVAARKLQLDGGTPVQTKAVLEDQLLLLLLKTSSNTSRQELDVDLGRKPAVKVQPVEFIPRASPFQKPIFNTPGQELKLDSNQPLPFEVYRRTSATMPQVGVYNGYIEPFNRTKDFISDSATGIPGIVMIREIVGRAAIVEEQEKLTKLSRLNHILKPLATVERGDQFWCLFPITNGRNLWDLWKECDKETRTPELVLWFLEEILGIVNAIKPLCGDAERHKSIAPHNILWFSTQAKPPGGTLVLRDTVNHSFNLYEAPERAIPDKKDLKLKPRYCAMWSLGCVVLELIIWIVWGFQEVENFRKLSNPTSAGGLCFTKPSGQMDPVITEILNSVRMSRSNSPPAETALSQLSRIIGDDLLQLSPERRGDVGQFKDKLAEIVSRAHREPQYCWSDAHPLPLIPRMLTPVMIQQRSSRPREHWALRHHDATESSTSGGYSNISAPSHFSGSSCASCAGAGGCSFCKRLRPSRPARVNFTTETSSGFGSLVNSPWPARRTRHAHNEEETPTLSYDLLLQEDQFATF